MIVNEINIYVMINFDRDALCIHVADIVAYSSSSSFSSKSSCEKKQCDTRNHEYFIKMHLKC